jgi:hypothetical protein
MAGINLPPPMLQKNPHKKKGHPIQLKLRLRTVSFVDFFLEFCVQIHANRTYDKRFNELRTLGRFKKWGFVDF